MSDAVKLEGVKVTFLHEGVKNAGTQKYEDIGISKTTKGGQKWGVKGQWVGADGTPEEHLLWSTKELRADMCGKAWTGTITVFPPSNPSYHPSRWFEVTGALPEKDADVPQKSTPSAQAPQPSVIPYEVREAATRRLLREAYDTTSEVMRGIMVDTPKNKRDSAMVFITASFPEIWKSAIMSLKIEGNVWPDILASEQNKYAESHGMPEDKEMAEPEPVAEVSQPEAAPDDLSDCPF